MNRNLSLWIKHVGAFAVLGILCWWIWDNPWFVVDSQEPGLFFDYDPAFLGTIVILYFFPAIFAVAFDRWYNPIHSILRWIDIDAEYLWLLGLVTAIVFLPLMYGTFTYVFWRIVKKLRNRMNRVLRLVTEKMRRI